MQLNYLRNNLGGKIVAQPILNEYRVLLVNQGVRLNLGLISSLKARGVKYVYTEEKGTEEIQVVDPLPRTAERQVAREVNEAFTTLRTLSGGEKTSVSAVVNRLSNDHRFKQLAPKGTFRKSVNQLVSDLYSVDFNSLSSFSLSMLGTNHLSHTLDVTLLSALLCKRFHYDFKETISLATAALLHDCGMYIIALPMDKPIGEYSEAEMKNYRNHPALGLQLLESMRCFSLMEMQTVMQHHEHQDGKGFPYGFKGSNREPVKSHLSEPGQIFRWAEIVAVADRYVNYCAGNYTPTPLTPHEAIMNVLQDSGTILNSNIVNELVNLINIFPVGTPVKVIDSNNLDLVGLRGVVSRVNEKFINRPELIFLRSRSGRKINPFKFDFINDKRVKLELAA